MSDIAHIRSKKNVFDPLYSESIAKPESRLLDSAPFWLYPRYDCEAFQLEVMRRDIKDAKLKVGYPGAFHPVSQTAKFSASLHAGIHHFRTIGTPKAFFDEKPVFPCASAPEYAFDLPADGKFELHLTAGTDGICAILPLDDAATVWQCESATPTPFPRSKDGVPPHLRTLPEVERIPKQTASNQWDAEIETFGYVEVKCEAEEHPVLHIGETECERDNRDPAFVEQTTELVSCDGMWKSKVPLAFRYIQVDGASAPEVRIRALCHPVAYRGAFVSDYAEMNKIWMHAAYTLRLCMNRFMLDGIKRDRLPWAGDLAVSLLANAFCFQDAALIRNTLSVLEAPGIQEKDINGIADYSLWILINHDFYQLYFGDRAFLEREYGRIVEIVECLLARRGAKGFLSEKIEWLFIDWVEGEKFTTLQILFRQSLLSAVRLAERMNDAEHIRQWTNAAEDLTSRINEECWSMEYGMYHAAPHDPHPTRHPNMFAVLTGLVTGSTAGNIADNLTDRKTLPPVGTPYMAIFEAWALAKEKKYEASLQLIRDIWGGMLKLGATSFFEAFDAKKTGNAIWEFYERPFALSCCHAWGAGPAFFLPMFFAGIRPLSDGWATFEVEPPSFVTNLNVTVPTPHGNIEVLIDCGQLRSVTAPDGCVRVTH